MHVQNLDASLPENVLKIAHVRVFYNDIVTLAESAFIFDNKRDIDERKKRFNNYTKTARYLRNFVPQTADSNCMHMARVARAETVIGLPYCARCCNVQLISCLRRRQIILERRDIKETASRRMTQDFPSTTRFIRYCA